jgi:putative FmdB family regulatory protein
LPTYEYECEKCLLRFELKKRFAEDGSAFCPRCGSEARLVFTPSPIIFKGSGFYVTDSRNGNERHLGKTKADKRDSDKK